MANNDYLLNKFERLSNQLMRNLTAIKGSIVAGEKANSTDIRGALSLMDRLRFTISDLFRHSQESEDQRQEKKEFVEAVNTFVKDLQEDDSLSLYLHNELNNHEDVSPMTVVASTVLTVTMRARHEVMVPSALLENEDLREKLEEHLGNCDLSVFQNLKITPEPDNVECDGIGFEIAW